MGTRAPEELGEGRVVELEEREAAWEANACSKDASERGGMPTERGTRESCWITLRCIRCFCV